jgi:hypothetical protein
MKHIIEAALLEAMHTGDWSTYLKLIAKQEQIQA